MQLVSFGSLYDRIDKGFNFQRSLDTIKGLGLLMQMSMTLIDHSPGLIRKVVGKKGCWYSVTHVPHVSTAKTWSERSEQ